ncbi:uncharacterized protein LOC134776818 [Penaeus indicus]|uniref:uncharacterized protein LOC134776818 n=1 Tax=Penaeus indicus TaxID=29960 RepID=UPI00300D1458
MAFGISSQPMHPKRADHKLKKTPDNDMLIIGCNLNSHLGERNHNYLDEHGQNGFGATKDEGEWVLETLQALKLYASNTGFRKNKEQLVTYRSGGHDTQVDYILARRENKSRVKDAKVLSYEVVTRLVVADIKKNMEKKLKPRKRPPSPPPSRVRKLKEKREEYNMEVNEFRKRLADREKASCEGHWDQMSEILLEAAKKCCGQTRGGRPRDNEAWW